MNASSATFAPEVTARRTSVKLKLAAPRTAPLELDSTSCLWQMSLDAAQRALSAAADTLPAGELARRRRELAGERQQTARALARLAVVTGVHPIPWLSPAPVTTKMLGLPATIRACVFDLDGVLTDSATLHAAAWGEVFDAFLLRLVEKTGWQFIPFDRETDYRAYIDGRRGSKAYTPSSTVAASAYLKGESGSPRLNMDTARTSRGEKAKRSCGASASTASTHCQARAATSRQPVMPASTGRFVGQRKHLAHARARRAGDRGGRMPRREADPSGGIAVPPRTRFAPRRLPPPRTRLKRQSRLRTVRQASRPPMAPAWRSSGSARERRLSSWPVSARITLCRAWICF